MPKNCLVEAFKDYSVDGYDSSHVPYVAFAGHFGQLIFDHGGEEKLTPFLLVNDVR